MLPDAVPTTTFVLQAVTGEDTPLLGPSGRVHTRAYVAASNAYTTPVDVPMITLPPTIVGAPFAAATSVAEFRGITKSSAPVAACRTMIAPTAGTNRRVPNAAAPPTTELFTYVQIRKLPNRLRAVTEWRECTV